MYKVNLLFALCYLFWERCGEKVFWVFWLLLAAVMLGRAHKTRLSVKKPKDVTRLHVMLLVLSNVTAVEMRLQLNLKIGHRYKTLL